MNVGDTFLLPIQGSHLNFICTLPNVRGEVAVLNLTSQDFDDACLIEVGDHPFVRHTSYIAYNRGKLYAESDIDAAVRSGGVVPREPATDALIQRIREGALKSDHAAAKLQRAVRECPWQPDSQ